VAAAVPAGAVILWLGSTLHGGGANQTSQARRGIVMSYSLGWLAPAEKFLLSISHATARKLPERLQRLIGYQTHRPNLGWVEGRDPLEWLHGQTRALAAAQDNLTPRQASLLARTIR
jgi:ectoine hydroxylase-related dioxygenase (phytanoyl-CoA dioxygenase family)